MLNIIKPTIITTGMYVVIVFDYIRVQLVQDIVFLTIVELMWWEEGMR